MQGDSEQGKKIKPVFNASVRWKARSLVLAASAAIIAGVWFYMHRNDPLRVRSLEIIDSKGKVYASLGPASNGQSGLILKDKEGLVRSELSVDESGCPCLLLFDKLGSVRAQMSITQNNRSTLRLADPHGLTRMEMEVNSQGKSVLKLHDSHSLKTNAFACDTNGNLQKITPIRTPNSPGVANQTSNLKAEDSQAVPISAVSVVTRNLKPKGKPTSSNIDREITQSSE